MVGKSVDILEHNANHSTVFYTSATNTVNQWTQQSMNYSFISTVQVLRLNSGNQNVFRTYTSANQYRQRTSDNVDKGALQLDYYHGLVFTSYTNLQTLYQMRVCNQSQYNDGYNCYSCDSGNFVQTFNGFDCIPCSSTFSPQAYSALIQLIYCPN